MVVKVHEALKTSTTELDYQLSAPGLEDQWELADHLPQARNCATSRHRPEGEIFPAYHLQDVKITELLSSCAETVDRRLGQLLSIL